ncbi:hypothetical protein QQ056_17115 [Oscillatoria laete-virens NRMC-F 0139]|nr:hypothetical protein [Oscillatoria laete-virens]MDL5055254.1 hypothetical protein [Oscillatoria laete-virens NRMC-F 0139]
MTSEILSFANIQNPQQVIFIHPRMKIETLKRIHISSIDNKSPYGGYDIDGLEQIKINSISFCKLFLQMIPHEVICANSETIQEIYLQAMEYRKNQTIQ